MEKTMEGLKEIIKEAVIKFVKSGTYDKEKTDNVINFLQRGWKFEAMWEELLRDTYYFPTRMVMANMKQKYFPKEGR